MVKVFCETCGGRGEMKDPRPVKSGPYMTPWVTCEDCDGDGYTEKTVEELMEDAGIMPTVNYF